MAKPERREQSGERRTPEDVTPTPESPGPDGGSDATRLIEDREGRPVLLLKSDWYLDRILEKNPELEFSPTA
jgi:hypothetical protein